MIIKDVISSKVYTSKLVGSHFCLVLNEMALSVKLSGFVLQVNKSFSLEFRFWQKYHNIKYLIIFYMCPKYNLNRIQNYKVRNCKV